MKEELTKLFTQNEISMSFSNIKRYLGVKKQHVNEELRSILSALELEGILYEDDDVFKSMPSYFCIRELKGTKKGNRYIEYNDDRIYINDNDLNGALIFDTVIIDIINPKVVKVLNRYYKNIVCEVILKDNVKYLKPKNIQGNLEVITGSKTMKKLHNNDLGLFKLSTNRFDNKYEVELIEVIGKSTDKDIEYDITLLNNGFNPKFNDNVLNEVKLINNNITQKDIDERIDLRKLKTFSIDEESTRSIDDALSVKRTKSGYKLYVHVSHVSHYIKMGSNIFEEAYNRCTSLYYSKTSIPMLPSKISDEVCSLNEKEDKLTRTIIIDLDKKCNIINYSIVKSIINSDKKMDYDKVDSIYNKKYVKGYESFHKELRTLKEINAKLNINSNFLSINRLCEGSSNNVRDIIKNITIISNYIIALEMIGKPCIYRNQSIIDNKLYSSLNLSKNLENLKTSFVINKLLKNAKNKDDLALLSDLMVSSLKLAYYGTSNEGHIGLGLNEGYVHFTSPLRKFPDLVVSYLLDIYEKKELTIDNLNEIEVFLKDVSSRSTKMERLAIKTQYELEDVSNLKKIKDMIGEEIEAYIEDITKDHLIIRCKNLVNGIMDYKDLSKGDFVMLPSGKIKSLSTREVYKKGHKLLVKIKDVNVGDKIIKYKEIKNLTLEELNENKLKRVIK